eukprot:m.147135 g.147135  ORF g.147135 m.147135 type:complete len:68 (-) comp30519_c2_seq1:122-325(-)
MTTTTTTPHNQNSNNNHKRQTMRVTSEHLNQNKRKEPTYKQAVAASRPKCGRGEAAAFECERVCGQQ